MASEAARHQLYEDLKRALSDASADELMSYLPPVGWADVATKADLGLIRSEMHAMRAELRGEMAELRGEMAKLGADLHRDMAALESRMGHGFVSMQRWVIGVNVMLATLLFAALRLTA